jgi:hypothetical protein
MTVRDVEEKQAYCLEETQGRQLSAVCGIRGVNFSLPDVSYETASVGPDRTTIMNLTLWRAWRGC